MAPSRPTQRLPGRFLVPAMLLVSLGGCVARIEPAPAWLQGSAPLPPPAAAWRAEGAQRSGTGRPDAVRALAVAGESVRLVWIRDERVTGEILLTRQRAEVIGTPPLRPEGLVAALRAACLPSATPTWQAGGHCSSEMGATTVHYGGDPLLPRRVSGPWGAVLLERWRVLGEGLLPGRLRDEDGAWTLDLDYGPLPSVSPPIGSGGAPATPQ